MMEKEGYDSPLPSDKDDEEGEDGGEVAAAQALIDAISAGDAKAASAALSSHYELCAAKHGEGEEKVEIESKPKLSLNDIMGSPKKRG